MQKGTYNGTHAELIIVMFAIHCTFIYQRRNQSEYVRPYSAVMPNNLLAGVDHHPQCQTHCRSSPHEPDRVLLCSILGALFFYAHRMVDLWTAVKTHAILASPLCPPWPHACKVFVCPWWRSASPCNDLLEIGDNPH